MQQDPDSGLWFEWIIDDEGHRVRDFTIRGQTDDRWDVDEATGEIVKVRDKASPQITQNGHSVTLDMGEVPPTCHRRRALASVIKAAKAGGAHRVEIDGYVIGLDAPLTDETGGNDMDRLLRKRKRSRATKP